MTAKAQTAKPSANGNGEDKAPDPLATAIAYEQAIADEAAEIRGDHKELTPELYLQLRPLLRKPIPSAFIVTTGKVEGKPYPSTGVKSLQVLTDRMDNVLTPFWWRYDVEFVGPEGVDARGVPNAGRLAEVTVYVVGSDHDKPLIVKRSRGGVNQASTIGNLFKGSETNAAKRAFAAIGPAWEVYVGAADFDPDTDLDAAGQQRAVDQTQAQALPVIDGDRVAVLTDIAQAWVTAVEGDEQKQRTTQITRVLRGEGLTGEIKSVTAGFARLTPGQADAVEAWLREQQSKGGEVS